MKLAILTSHPIQYQAPLFRALAARSDVSLKVFFCWDFGVRPQRDPGFDREVMWDVPLLGGYEHEFLRNTSLRPGTDHFQGLVNPEAWTRISAWKPDAAVLHGYNHRTELEFLWHASRAKLPVLMRGESNLLVPRPLWLRAVKRPFLHAVLGAVSGALAIGTLNREYYRHYAVPDERVTLAPYTVDNAFFRGKADEARAEARAWRARLDVGDEQPVVLFAAKLSAVKACGDLIRAFAHSRHAREAALVIVGDGALRGELAALAASYSDVAIRFAGFANQGQMPSAYALGDVYVLPSHREPWGLAINEAMSLGLPVVVSDQVGCAPDLVSPRNGWRFPAGDVQALTRVLDEALSDPDGLRTRGEASAERMKTWDIPQTAEGYVRGIQAAMKRLEYRA